MSIVTIRPSVYYTLSADLYLLLPPCVCVCGCGCGYQYSPFPAARRPLIPVDREDINREPAYSIFCPSSVLLSCDSASVSSSPVCYSYIASPSLQASLSLAHPSLSLFSRFSHLHLRIKLNNIPSSPPTNHTTFTTEDRLMSRPRQPADGLSAALPPAPSPP